jgi:2-polyprenyl-3-methyl-5-hydroxy-6-metoxy-1,4-benzoquinol methylase
MTQEMIYNDQYFTKMRGSDELYLQFAAIIPLQILKEKAILDVGCGPGRLLATLANQGCNNLTGLDFSSIAIHQAESSLLSINTPRKISLIKGSVADANLFPSGNFDVVYMLDVVEHLPPDVLAQAFKNLRLWLRPGGCIVVHTFPTLGPHRMYRALLKFLGKNKILDELDAIHCNVQSRSTISQTIINSGLRIERIWLENNIINTSSLYQRLPQGLLKSSISFLIQKIFSSSTIQKTMSAIGLAEFVSPSIFVICYSVTDNLTDDRTS